MEHRRWATRRPLGMKRNNVFKFDVELIFENEVKGKCKGYHRDTVPAMPEWPATPTCASRARGIFDKEGALSIVLSIIRYIPMK